MIAAASSRTPPIFDRRAGGIRLSVDSTGRLAALADVARGVNCIAPDEPSFLIGCSVYEGDGASVLAYPAAAKLSDDSQNESIIRLSFEHGVTLDVKVTACDNYFRLELAGATPASEVRMISWGPYHTTMKGQFGEWLGLNRSDDFTLGLLTLEPNTDGDAARHTPYGSEMQLISYDHTRGRFIGGKDAKRRRAAPLPGRTVVGSAVALFGCPAGRNNELATIEKIECAEGLPHPLVEGEWNKRSREGQKLSVWAHYTEENFEEYLAVARDMGARLLCRPHGFFRNWGHFEVDPVIYPGGLAKIREHVRLAKTQGIGLTEYTLTTFLIPHPDPEPYLSPVPDDRLQTWEAGAALMADIGPGDTQLLLKNTPAARATLETAEYKVIRVDDEMIEFKEFTPDGEKIVIRDCQRGAFHTTPAGHAARDDIRIMYVAGNHNFYPGTLDLSNEVGERLSDILLATDFDNVVFDGFESCKETGYGAYTGNIFLKAFYDKCRAQHKQTLVTGSNFSAYTWHILSHISWGELDTERGFRGSMLDYRLYRQIQLRRNLMPCKIGQYYPDSATAEDIRWLMALLAGWDSGVDIELNTEKFKNNPEYNQILKTFHLWESAMNQNVFTDEQKMHLRQTDLLHKLSQADDGRWLLEFDRRWLYDNIRVLPPSAMNARPGNPNSGSVKACSIDWTWTHNPGFYNEVGLSDDLIHAAGEKPTSWNVDFPVYEEPDKSWLRVSERNFLFIIRLADNAPCAVRNFRIMVDDQVVDVPVTLKPGQYISTPHILEMACIYDSDHKVAGEVFLHGKLPRVFKGKTSRILLSCEPVEQGLRPEVLMNARFQNGYFHQY